MAGIASNFGRDHNLGTCAGCRPTCSGWAPLNRYADDGDLEIDNDVTEHTIRSAAVDQRQLDPLRQQR
jgi:hypothetical protein